MKRTPWVFYDVLDACFRTPDGTMIPEEMMMNAKCLDDLADIIDIRARQRAAKIAGVAFQYDDFIKDRESWVRSQSMGLESTVPKTWKGLILQCYGRLKNLITRAASKVRRKMK